MAFTTEEKKERKKQYYEKNKEAISKKGKKYYKKNKKIINKKSKKYYESNKETIIENHKKYYEDNKEIINKKSRNYYDSNKEKIFFYNKKYCKLKRNNEPLFNLSCSIRTAMSNSFRNKGYTKKSRSFEILGCSFEDFKTHLENQFESWMNWENKGNPKDGKFEPNKTWDIDHIIPISSATSEEEIIKLNHYTNLRPLCSYYNRFVKRHHIEEDLKKDLVDNL
jgi:hypothetical protein